MDDAGELHPRVKVLKDVKYLESLHLWLAYLLPPHTIRVKFAVTSSSCFTPVFLSSEKVNPITAVDILFFIFIHTHAHMLFGLCGSPSFSRNKNIKSISRES